MFIITNGIIEVFIEAEGERQVLAHLRRGDYFGEMALLTGLPSVGLHSFSGRYESLWSYERGL